MMLKNIFPWLFIGLVLLVTLSSGHTIDSDESQQGHGTAGDDAAAGLSVINVGSQTEALCSPGQYMVRGKCRGVSNG
jgi:hypothetical protein